MKNKNAKIFVNSITMVRLIGTITLPIASKYLSTWGLIIYLAILLLTDAFDGMMARSKKHLLYLEVYLIHLQINY